MTALAPPHQHPWWQGWRKWCLTGLLLLVPSMALAQQVAVPPLAGPVIDLTATLGPDEQAALSQRLADYARSKGSQVQVLIVPTTQPEEIEQYSIRVADVWKLGRAKIDDGVILVIAKNDHRMRIEVGRGLEGAIPDIYAKRIIADVITPLFRAGRYADGIDAGVTAILKLIDGEALPAVQQQPKARVHHIDLGLILFAVFIGSIFASGIRRVAGSAAGAVSGLGLGGVLGFLIGGGLIWALIAGIGAVVFGFAQRGGGLGGGGGWSTGGFGGGWSGGSSFGDGGGGGWSGGGGGFGGGGASGSW